MADLLGWSDVNGDFKIEINHFEVLMLKQEIKSAWSDLIALGKDHKAIINEFMSALSWMKQGIRDFGYGFQLLSTLIWYLILLTVFIVFFPVLLPVVLYMRRKAAKARKAEIERVMRNMSPVSYGKGEDCE
jgi:uncharacterized membrane protein